MDCILGWLLKIQSSESFFPVSEGRRGWSVR